MGPRLDFRVGRTKEADVEMLKEAMRKPKGLEVRSNSHAQDATTETNNFTGQDKEEHRNRHHRRQDRPHPHRQAGPQPAADQEDEGSQAQPRRARRRGRFRRRRRPAQRRRKEGSHRLKRSCESFIDSALSLFVFLSSGLAFSAWRWWAMCKKNQMYCCFRGLAWHLSDQNHIHRELLNRNGILSAILTSLSRLDIDLHQLSWIVLSF